MRPALLTAGAPRSTLRVVDLDELSLRKPDDPLAQLARQDLDPFSVDELQARIEALRAEIARSEAKIAQSVTHMSAAEALFRK